MPIANVFNMAGEKIGEIELSEAIFGIEPNKNVLHDCVKNHLANCRQGTQSAQLHDRKALAPEGHRPRTRRLCRLPRVVPRRRSICPQAQRLQLHPQPQGQETGS